MTAPSSPFVVGIAGGSGSGKTTLARALADVLGPARTAVLGHDAYYCDRADVARDRREAIDYDVPEALDQAHFLADLCRLRAGLPVTPPRYCFATHRRTGAAPVVEPREVVLVEGILLLHDPAVREALDLRIFLDAPQPLRVERRLDRDVGERGRTRESVLRQLAATVQPAHQAYVEPTKVFADLILLNAGPLPPLVEVAATVIRAHLARRAAVHAAEASGRVPRPAIPVHPYAEELPGVRPSAA